MEMNSAFIAFAIGLLQILPFVFSEMFGFQFMDSTVDNKNVGTSNTTTGTALQNVTLSFSGSSQKLFLQILASNGVIILTFFLSIASATVFHAVRCNDELFDECAAVLTQARASLFPRHSDSAISSGVRSTRRWRSFRGSNTRIYTEAGSNMSAEDRHLLADAIAACIEEIRYPTESKEPIEALGIPLTPRIIASLGLALVSTTAAAAFRLLTG